MSTFVDTSALLAVLDASDVAHKVADRIWRRLIESDERLVSTNYVLVETFALVQRRLGLPAVRVRRRAATMVGRQAAPRGGIRVATADSRDSRRKLERAISRFIAHWIENAEPFRWNRYPTHHPTKAAARFGYPDIRH